MLNTGQCPLCNYLNAKISNEDYGNILIYDCEVCGKYTLSKATKTKIESLFKGDRAKFSAIIRERSIHRDLPKVDLDSHAKDLVDKSSLSTKDVMNTLSESLPIKVPAVIEPKNRVRKLSLRTK